MKFGIFCVVIFVCVVMYALMDTAKKSDKSGELWEKYLKENDEKKQEE